MTTLTTTRVRTAIARMRDTWSELEYAQQRAFELRTGVPVIDRRPVIARTPEELESLYAASADR